MKKRVFDAGPLPGPVNFKDVRIGVPICEDIWSPDVVECLEESGAELLLVPNGSPFQVGKPEVRLNLVVERVVESGLPLVYVNQVGGQDELAFDGASFVIDGDRRSARPTAGLARSLRHDGVDARAQMAAGPAPKVRSRMCPRAFRRCITRRCCVCAITSTRMASRALCSAYPAGLIRLSRRR